MSNDRAVDVRLASFAGELAAGLAAATWLRVLRHLRESGQHDQRVMGACSAHWAEISGPWRVLHGLHEHHWDPGEDEREPTCGDCAMLWRFRSLEGQLAVELTADRIIDMEDDA